MKFFGEQQTNTSISHVPNWKFVRYHQVPTKILFFPIGKLELPTNQKSCFVFFMLATLFLAHVATLWLAHVAIGNVPTFFLLYQKPLTYGACIHT
jgi:hypothetical protein